MVTTADTVATVKGSHVLRLRTVHFLPLFDTTAFSPWQLEQAAIELTKLTTLFQSDMLYAAAPSIYLDNSSYDFTAALQRQQRRSMDAGGNDASMFFWNHCAVNEMIRKASSAADLQCLDLIMLRVTMAIVVTQALTPSTSMLLIARCTHTLMSEQRQHHRYFVHKICVPFSLSLAPMMPIPVSKLS